MRYEITAALFVVSAFLIYTTVNAVLTRRRHARQAARLGCKPINERPYNWPLGLDLLWRLMEADKRQEVPDEFNAIHKEMGVDTWSQYLLGGVTLTTIEPKNIQAILATQFHDFALGETRRRNFFPLFGNGIFTSDGKTWYAVPKKESAAD